MGVWFFIPLGYSPGAATSALAYFKRKIEEGDEHFFGDSPKSISGIVLFTTKEIRNKDRSSIRPFRDNEYNSKWGKRDRGPVFEVVYKFINKELAEMLERERGKIYFCESSLNKLETNIVNASKALLELSSRGKTGKEIWMNITGGNNPITASLILTSFLSGLVGRIYYTFVPHNKTEFLRPTSDSDFQWIDIPVVKIGFDRSYYKVLKILSKNKGWVSDEKLFNMLKPGRLYRDLSIDGFRREILNKLHGQGIIRRKDSENQLSDFGEYLLNFVGLDILETLATPGKKVDFPSSLELIKKF